MNNNLWFRDVCSKCLLNDGLIMLCGLGAMVLWTIDESHKSKGTSNE